MKRGRPRKPVTIEDMVVEIRSFPQSDAYDLAAAFDVSRATIKRRLHEARTTIRDIRDSLH